MPEKMSAKDKAGNWLKANNMDDESKNKITQLLESEDELNEAFFHDLEFGTGGLRGIMGIGTNRINKYTVGMATQGFANYLKSQFSNEIKVAIAHDSRNNSRLFAETTAAVFSANGIKVFLFEDLRPTPELSFAIRHLGCQGGVVLTASHNPKEYNGYKAYWSDGGQLVPPHDKNVIAEVKKINSIDEINFDSNPELIESLGKDLDMAYLEMIKGLSLDPKAIADNNDLRIVFSSIHGTGITMVPQALKELGFKNVHIVKSQENPDGNFPTVVYPNPEEKEAMSLALKEAEKIDADLVMATDPDADRVGIAVKNTKGEFQLLNGNQTGALLVFYLMKKWDEKGLKGNEYIGKTIVTTELIRDIANSFNTKCYDTLTGFKWIADMIREREGKEVFIGGGEESYGYMIGEAVRDKDAVASSVIIAELTAWAKGQGLSVFELLTNIYDKYGFYYEELKSITKKGLQGAEEIQRMMSDFRSNPPKELAGSRVTYVIDYSVSKKIDEDGKKEYVDLPKSNVLQYLSDDGTKVSIRPSGTEPKIKFYFSVKGKLEGRDYFSAEKKLKSKVHNLLNDLNL
ncbi:phosphoglucomutase [Ekhidna lutea]|uniref:Phosphoglucomutase n=1 Tax=Ekhidna lutea TaxID=447679 RepID=A0A239M926_EKHLU|nr:phospho-sugar mutase [Ekhidna lutea]SNT38692.1 phosphoglucomutase [Ekhidna lutea]